MISVRRDTYTHTLIIGGGAWHAKHPKTEITHTHKPDGAETDRLPFASRHTSQTRTHTDNLQLHFCIAGQQKIFRFVFFLPCHDL